jgi:hypothetical protein
MFEKHLKSLLVVGFFMFLSSCTGSIVPSELDGIWEGSVSLGFTSNSYEFEIDGDTLSFNPKNTYKIVAHRLEKTGGPVVFWEKHFLTLKGPENEKEKELVFKKTIRNSGSYSYSVSGGEFFGRLLVDVQRKQ